MTRLVAKQTSHSNQSYCCGSFGTWGGSISVTLSLTSKIWSDIMISNYWLFLNRKLYIVSYRVLHSKWDFFFGLHGGDENSHIWVMWKDRLRLSPMFSSSQSITLSIHIQHDRHAVVFCIYASCLKRIRQLLWEHLDFVYASIRQTVTHWLLVGDFNVIASAEEKQGGHESDRGAIQDFQQCIMRNGLLDAGYKGEAFTWYNNRKGREWIL